MGERLDLQLVGAEGREDGGVLLADDLGVLLVVATLHLGDEVDEGLGRGDVAPIQRLQETLPPKHVHDRRHVL